MKIYLIAVAIALCFGSLYGSAYDEQINNADKLFKAGKGFALKHQFPRNASISSRRGGLVPSVRQAALP